MPISRIPKYPKQASLIWVVIARTGHFVGFVMFRLNYDSIGLFLFSGKPCAIGSKAVCNPCEKNYYKDTKGTSECIPCPTGEGTIEKGAKFCLSKWAVMSNDQKLLQAFSVISSTHYPTRNIQPTASKVINAWIFSVFVSYNNILHW